MLDRVLDKGLSSSSPVARNSHRSSDGMRLPSTFPPNTRTTYGANAATISDKEIFLISSEDESNNVSRAPLKLPRNVAQDIGSAKEVSIKSSNADSDTIRPALSTLNSHLGTTTGATSDADSIADPDKDLHDSSQLISGNETGNEMSPPPRRVTTTAQAPQDGMQMAAVPGNVFDASIDLQHLLGPQAGKLRKLYAFARVQGSTKRKKTKKYKFEKHQVLQDNKPWICRVCESQEDVG
jgi:hypothetical protein